MELEEFLERVPDPDLLQADERANAVIDVNDEVADFQVPQIGEKRLRRRSAALRCAPVLFEHVGFGVDLERCVRQPETARQPADRHQHRRVARIVGAFDRHREEVVLLQQLDGAFGAAGRGGDEERGFALFAEAPNLVHPVRDAASQLDRRLAADVTYSGTFVERNLRQAGRVGEPGFDIRPIGKQRIRRRRGERPRVPRRRFLVAALDAVEEFP